MQGILHPKDDTETRQTDIERGAQIIAKAVSDKFDGITNRLNSMDDRFDKIDVRLDSLVEVTQATLEIVSKQPTRQEFNDLRDEVHVIRVALTDTNKDQQKHARRIAKLERRAG
jgi:hypothetical protein